MLDDLDDFEVEEIEDDSDDDSDDEPELCSACNGSGEGQYEGSRCYVCHGKGTVSSDD